MLLMAFMAPWGANAQTYVYNKVTEAPSNWTTGKYLLVYSDSRAAANSTTTSGYYWYLNTVSVSVQSNTIEETNGAEVVSLELYSGSTYYIKNSENKYLKATRYKSGSTYYPRFEWVTTADSYNCGWQMTFNSGNITLKWNNNNDYKMAVSNNYITLSGTASSFSLYLQVEAVVSNPKPRNLTAGTPGSHTMSYTWDAPNNASPVSYTYQYKLATGDWDTPADVTSVTTANADTRTANLSGLVAETNYNFRVRANYASESSDWVNADFSTTEACPAPEISAFTASGTTATVTWTGNATSYDVYYSTSNTLPDTPEPQYTAVEGNSQAITNLSIDNTYYVWVKANCGGEDGSSTWAGPESVFIGYCTPNPSSRDGQGITGVSFGTGSVTVNNSNISGLPASSPYYGNYSAMVGAIEAGTVATISITTATGSYPYGFIIWVDYNNDLTFSDAEIVYTGQCSSGSGTLDATFTIPANQTLGDYRMRIAGADTYFDSYIGGSSSGDHDACFSSTYAVCHDYTLRVIVGNSCTLVPSGFGFTKSYTSATATWSTEGGESCDIYYSTTNSAPAQDATPSQAGITGTSNSYSYKITGLTANTPYYVWVRVNCSASEHGNWRSAGSFTTKNCVAPSNLEFTEIAYNTAKASWESPSEDVENYSYQYKAGTGSWTDEATTSNTYIVLGELTEETTYTFKVKANYPGNASSEFTEKTFDTPASCLVPTGFAADAMVTSASLTWTAGDSETNWLLYYSETNSAPAENLTEIGTYVKAVSGTPAYILTGLTTGTTYYAWVRANCGGDDYSHWVGPVEFTPSTGGGYTINDENTTDGSSVPIYGTQMDNGCWSQFIIPAEDLSDIAGSSISAMTFYSSLQNSTSTKWDDASYDIYLAIVEKTTFGSSTPDAWGENMTKVYQGSLSISDYKMVVTFNASFNYTGGNLFIGFNETASDGWESFSWTGVSKPGGSSIYGYSSTTSTGYFLPKTTFTYSFDYDMEFTGTGSWGENGNWVGGAAPTIDDNVLIQHDVTIPDGTVAYANLITLDGGNITIENGGQLVTKLPVAATVKKTTAASTPESKDAAVNKWYAIASPINNGVISSFVQGTHNVYRYDEENIEWEEYRNSANEFTTFQNGRGYLYRSTEDNVAYTGTVNAANVNYTLSYACSNDDFKGFNLIGNPFTHNIYKGAAGTAIPNGELLEAKYYVLNTDGTWTLTDDGTAIPSGTAILVQAKSGDALTITNTNSTGSKGRAFNDNIWFTLKNSEFTDVACVEFKEGRGLNKMAHYNENVPMLYVKHNGENFASVDMPDDTKTINLCFKATEFGYNTLSLKANGNFSYLHLIDRLTGEDVDMLLDGEYSFMASPTDNPERFIVKLEYSEGSETTEVFAYQNGSDIIVNGEGELQVFDVTGRMVKIQRINGVQTINLNTQGVYIFKLNDKVQKVVVR